MAFVDIGAPASRVALRAGRQELVYGDQRLVGHVSWLNAARTCDGARLTLRTSPFSVDAFAVSVVRTLVDEFDRSGAGNRFAGAYATTTRIIPGATVEPYLFWKRDVNLRGERGAVGDLQHATAGARIAGKLPARLDYGVEMALQRGSLAAEDVRAWAGHWQLRAPLPGPGAMTLTGEYNFASGDADSSDGVRGTFDQLYPTPHDKTGLADQVGWKNIHHLRASVEFTPLKGLPLLYLRAATPAAATCPSWALVPPETPMAPTILPPMAIGTPPSTGTAPCSARMRSPSPPAASASWNAFVGRLNRAAERALLMATSTLPTCASSIRSRYTRSPEISTMAMTIAH